MGAFYLYNKSADIDIESVRSIFEKKGFSEPYVFDLGFMTLWHYRKQLVPDPNYVILDNGSALYATGTVVYKGLSYRDTLHAILADYCLGRLEMNALLGNFCLIFYMNEQIRILTDRLCAHHIFVNDSLEKISTSFLAMLVSTKIPHHLNRLACYEKFFTGYIVGPDTLVDGILQVTPILQENLGNEEIHFLSQGLPESNVTFCKTGRQTCVREQLDGLLSYFDQIRLQANEYGCELGLSSGYDSRLALLLARNVGISMSIHTHRTGNVLEHELGYRYIREIVEEAKVDIREISTVNMDLHPEERLKSILYDGLYYFDGRNSHNMGAFSETYTRQYKTATLGNNRFGLNGLGGEIFRNYYFTSLHRFAFRPWMQNHVYYAFSWQALPDHDMWRILHSWIVQKMSKRLQVDLSGNVDILTMRRYYSDIRMPDCDANNNNAHNQLAFFLTPFIEYFVVQNGYRATPYIGQTGKFEAAMLEILDVDIAKVGSHYGFPLTNEPLKHKVYGFFRGYLPDWFWVLRNRFRIEHQNLGYRNLENYIDLYKHSMAIQEIEETLRAYFPEIDWRLLFCDNASKANSIYIGYFLNSFNSYLIMP